LCVYILVAACANKEDDTYYVISYYIVLHLMILFKAFDDK